MSTTKFKVAGTSYADGEMVFHTSIKEFAPVCGATGTGRVILLFPSPRNEYAALPEYIRQDVEDARAFDDELALVDGGLQRWFRQELARGASVVELKQRLRAAVGVRLVEEA